VATLTGSGGNLQTEWAATFTGIHTLTGQQLNWLLDGHDIMRMQAHERLHYHSVL
jgi:hypothetical protein